MLPTAWWCRNNLLFTYYMGSSLHEQLHSNLKLAQLWTQRWMFHSEVDVGNKLSTQTPSSAHWMGTRSHLRMAFTCVVAIYISDASSYNCCYNDHGIYLRLMNRQNYFLVFWARTGSTLLSMKSKYFSQGVQALYYRVSADKRLIKQYSIQENWEGGPPALDVPGEELKKMEIPALMSDSS